MKRKLFYLLIPVLTAFMFQACGGSGESEENYETEAEDVEAVDETPVDATYDQLLNGDIEEGKTVVFETFVAPLPSTMYFGDGELSLHFYERRNQSAGRSMRVDIPTGAGKNHVEQLPETYYQEDLKIHTDNGDVAVIGDRVRVTGKFSEASDENYQYIDLVKIEKIDYEFSESVFESAEELTNEFIEDKTKDDGYAYIEGTLELMIYMSSYDGSTYAVTIHQNNNKYTESVYINIGTGPSSMNELPDNFSNADFIVRDCNGTEHKGAKTKFRLYGTFNQLDGIESKGMFNVEEIVAL